MLVLVGFARLNYFLDGQRKLHFSMLHISAAFRMLLSMSGATAQESVKDLLLVSGGDPFDGASIRWHSSFDQSGSKMTTRDCLVHEQCVSLRLKNAKVKCLSLTLSQPLKSTCVSLSFFAEFDLCFRQSAALSIAGCVPGLQSTCPRPSVRPLLLFCGRSAAGKGLGGSVRRLVAGWNTSFCPPGCNASNGTLQNSTT